MILNFSVQNFGSIKDKQTLSFEADTSKHLEDVYVVKIGNKRILKLALIYGANASGKTTVLKALDFLRDLILEPEDKKTDKLDFRPFLFDSVTPKKNSILSLEFIKNEVRYYYEVEFNNEAIVREELNFFKPKKANIYKRQTDLSKQLTEITFGSKIKINKASEDSLVSNTLWNNTVLGGYLKTNIDIQVLREVTKWFENYLSPLLDSDMDLRGDITRRVSKGQIPKVNIINILKKADFNISDIKIQEEDAVLSDRFLQILKEDERFSEEQVKELFTSFDIQFVHSLNGAKYFLPFDEESQGTQRYYDLAGLLALVTSSYSALSIDELESSLHPDLYTHFLLNFLLNSKESQIIATTHNREILGEKDLFREDAIWFTDKNKDCSTELYSLADFDSSVIRNSSNILNAYKSGKLSGVPNLGDTYIDIEK